MRFEVDIAGRRGNEKKIHIGPTKGAVCHLGGRNFEHSIDNAVRCEPCDPAAAPVSQPDKSVDVDREPIGFTFAITNLGKYSPAIQGPVPVQQTSEVLTYGVKY